jgi:hypothetical protein
LQTSRYQFIVITRGNSILATPQHRVCKRLNSFCVAKPMQKLRWTERGGAEASAGAYEILSRG